MVSDSLRGRDNIEYKKNSQESPITLDIIKDAIKQAKSEDIDVTCMPRFKQELFDDIKDIFTNHKDFRELKWYEKLFNRIKRWLRW